MITVTVSNRVELTGRIPGQVRKTIQDRLTVSNPAHMEAKKRGFSTWDIPQQIRGYKVDGDALIIPRGFIRQLVGILRRAGVQYCLEDRRLTLAPVAFTFHGQLRDFQETAVEAMAAQDCGVLSAPTGSGKTVMALALIARCQQLALAVVHTQELQRKWIARIETFLGIPAGQVGVIGGGKYCLHQGGNCRLVLINKTS